MTKCDQKTSVDNFFKIFIRIREGLVEHYPFRTYGILLNYQAGVRIICWLVTQGYKSTDRTDSLLDLRWIKDFIKNFVKVCSPLIPYIGIIWYVKILEVVNIYFLGNLNFQIIYLLALVFIFEVILIFGGCLNFCGRLHFYDNLLF